MNRSEKYSDILEENEEKDLSLTRELKFKDLQSSIDSEDNAPTQEIIVSNNSIEEEKTVLKKEENKQLQDQDLFYDVLEDDLPKTRNTNPSNEDIYLTQSFKPLTFPKRVGRIFKPILKIFLFILCFSVIGYFGIYPFIKQHYLTTSKEVFIKTLNQATDNIISFLSNEEDIFSVNGIVSIDSEQEKLKQFNGELYSLQYTYDNLSKDQEAKISILINDTIYGLRYINEKSNIFIGTTNSTGITPLSENNINESTNLQNDYHKTTDDIKKIIELEKDILFSLVNKENFTKNKDMINVNNKELNVTRYTFSLEEQELKLLIAKHNQELIQNNNLMEQYTRLFNTTKKDFIKNITSWIENNEIETLSINIYLDAKNNFIGLDFEKNGFRPFYYYQDNDEYNAYISLAQKQIDVKKTSNSTVATLKTEGTEKATIYITKQSSTDYSLEIHSADLKTKINCDLKRTNATIDKSDIVSSIKYDEELEYLDSKLEQENKLSAYYEFYNLLNPYLKLFFKNM